MKIDLPATVRQYAEASGWSQGSIRKFVRKGLLRVDPTAVPTLIVGGEVLYPEDPKVYRCPFTPDMFPEVPA